MATLVTERYGAVLVGRLNRPDALNALSLSLVAKLREFIETGNEDVDTRVMVLTGNGRGFCAGGDLGYINELRSRQDTRGLQDYLDRVTVLLNAIETSPVPVIAAVNGLATGGGLEMILCCDIAIAAESARLGDGHANFGLLPTGGASIRLPRRVGMAQAKYMLLTGALCSSREMMAAGLLHQVVPDDDLESAAVGLAATLADRSPLALARVKQLVHDGLEQPVAAGIRLEAMASELHRTSRDFNEGIEAFNEKRKPTFTGQ